jgi:Cu+-exporting ATPase
VSYYLNQNPGINQRIAVRPDKFAFLEDDVIQKGLINFQDAEKTQVTFYLPQMHCSSCIYSLESLYKLNSGIISSRANFTLVFLA